LYFGRMIFKEPVTVDCMKRALFLILFLAMLPAVSAASAAGPPATTPPASAVTAAGSDTLTLPISAVVIAERSAIFAVALTSTLPVPRCHAPQDSLGKQILYNGRVWRNLYQHIDGTQFLFSSDFIHGSVTMNGMTFNSPDLMLKLDLINDELLLLTDRGSTLQLNKQMVDRFTLRHDNRQLQFRNLEADSLNGLRGYVNVIHEGKTALYVRYKKEIRLRDGPGDRDTFIQTHRIYLVKDGIAHQVNNRKNLVSLLKDRKTEVKDFMKTNRVQISRNNPVSFAPVLEYYDKLK
jgi:hypothetical protein